MSNLLSVSDVVNVQISLAPVAAGYRSFGDMMILGSSAVIDVVQRMRFYAGLTGIAQDFGTTAPEYLAAQAFFGQSPQPSRLWIGRWAQAATAGLLHGAPLTAAQQVMANFTGITSGGFDIHIDGVDHQITGLNFSAALNLNGVAAIIQAALPSGVTCIWGATNKRFDIISSTTGTSSTVGYGAAPSSGADISTLLGLTAASGASAPVVGIAAETLLSCVNTLMNMSSAWYGLTVATATPPVDADHIAVATAINAAQLSRIYAVTTSESGSIDPTSSTDIGASLQTALLARCFVIYSTSSPYAAASALARLATIDYTVNNTTITMKFKQLPGVTPEQLTETAAVTLVSKNINVFASFQNGTQIFKEGVMSNGYFIDEVVNSDWFQNALQTDLYNVLYQSPTKTPQTDDGVNQLVTQAKATCARASNNGFLAAGVWTGPPIGKIKTNDVLPLGYFVYAPPVANQSPADREARKAPTLQILAKQAGAIHFANVLVSVNR